MASRYSDNYLCTMRLGQSMFVVVVLCFVVAESFAQCPMCRIAAESNLENGGSAGLGLNSGILYMLMMPYILVALLGYLWYRNRKKTGTEITPTLPLSKEALN